MLLGTMLKLWQRALELRDVAAGSKVGRDWTVVLRWKEASRCW
jgi:hypothetical protein